MSHQYADKHCKKNIANLQGMKLSGEKISCLTAYDATFSALMQRAGIDVILVGDSLGMVFQGHDSTLPVSIDDMVYHTKAVCRGASDSFVIADLPFMSYSTAQSATENAARLIQQGGAQMIKLEGAKINIIHAMVNQGIPVCAHLGLLPQFIYQLGTYKVQGKSEQAAEIIFNEAEQVVLAGAQLLILECIPALLAKKISATLDIPVIGIGSGVHCNGQILVAYDMLGLNLQASPRFTRNYLQTQTSIFDALVAYHNDVKAGVFPSIAESF